MECQYSSAAALIDPSAATDLEIIRYLRAVTERDGSSDHAAPAEVMNHSRLASQHPSELIPRGFVEQRPSSLRSLRTTHGTWKEKHSGAYTTVRIGGGVAVTSSPRYVGVKRVLQFHNHKGAKTGWNMTQYYLVHNLVIEDKVCFCKVLELKGDGHNSQNKKQKKGDSNSSKKKEKKIGDASSSSPAIQVLAPVNQPPIFSDQCEEMMIDPRDQEHPLFGDMQMDPLPSTPQDFESNCCFKEEEDEEEEEVVLVPDGGRKQQMSQLRVWDHFTKIFQNEEQYAACHLCEAMLKASSTTNGTSTLRRHYKKHLKQPTQAS